MSDNTESILEAKALYHVYDSKAEDGNVIALRGLHAVSYTHLTLPTIYSV